MSLPTPVAGNPTGPGRTPRIPADSEDLGKGLGQLVVALLELVRDLLERQAIRRMDGGDLSADEIERLGRALMALDERFAELRDVFGVEPGGLRLPFDAGDLLDSTQTRQGDHPGKTDHRRDDLEATSWL